MILYQPFLKNSIIRCFSFIEEFKSGKRYLKIQEDHKRIIVGYIKEIKRLKTELAVAHAQAVTVRNIWTDECDRLWQEDLTEISAKDEKIRRLYKYKHNYFAWVNDFTIPTTNNLSEQVLRGVKTKMKVSGQFASSETVDNYAVVRTYVATCLRNGINEMTALSRLCVGNPYTVEEIFSTA